MSEHGPDGADPDRWADPAATYDVVATAYAERFLHELDHKPFDRALLQRFAVAIGPGSSAAHPACDLGCGPGHIGAFLATAGVEVMGIDLSAGMVAVARRSFPDVTFAQGDMTSLTVPDRAFSAVVCFYALIHIPRARVPDVLRDMRRVLVPGGALLVAVHGGEGSLHADQMAGLPADLDATLFSLGELSAMLETAGFSIVEAHERAPYHEEHPTQRLYIWATRPV